TPKCWISIVAPASPIEEARLRKGCEELVRLGYQPDLPPQILNRKGYFAGSLEERVAAIFVARTGGGIHPIFCARGGYGSNYLVEYLQETEDAIPGYAEADSAPPPPILIGHSDITTLQIFYWQTMNWVTFYGPMVAAGFDAGEGNSSGYDLDSFHRAMTETRAGWPLDMRGETLLEGEAEGTLLGGCLSLVQTSLGTPWELDTAGSILLLEDRGMKPYQVDRALMHLQQAGKFEGVRGIILGEFPECDPPEGSDITVRQVLERIIGGLEIPTVGGAPIGHTPRPMLTVPLGVRARLLATGTGRLDILEPACIDSPPVP
ncbi:MAG TPA: LD-carboxypeptidase, partial [Candidatus Acidoferrales bacterium]|nr:LD-carboxypeptidase [Candidatus Acidoferrales bacterium]